MLHAAELIAGQHHHTVLFERTGDARIPFHPVESLGCLVKYPVNLCRLVSICLTVQNTHGPSVAERFLLFEVACREGIEIGG